MDVLGDAPASATAGVKSAAEQRLLADAAELDAVGLRRLGSYIWQVVDPEAADAAEAQRLEVGEQHAHEQRRFVLTPVGDGMTRITGRLPDLSAALVRTALAPLAAPLPSSIDGPDPRRAGERTADALVEIARRSIAGRSLPDDGGEKPRLIVTVPHTAALPEPRPGDTPGDTPGDYLPGSTRRPDRGTQACRDRDRTA